MPRLSPLLGGCTSPGSPGAGGLPHRQRRTVELRSDSLRGQRAGGAGMGRLGGTPGRLRLAKHDSSTSKSIETRRWPNNRGNSVSRTVLTSTQYSTKEGFLPRVILYTRVGPRVHLVATI